MPAMIEQFVHAGEKACEEASLRAGGSYDEASRVLKTFLAELEAAMPGLARAWFVRGKLYTDKSYERFIVLPDDMSDWPVRGDYPVFGHYGKYQSLVIFREDADDERA